MGNGDPLETVSQLRVWVEGTLSSLRNDSVRTATVRKKHRKINGVIDQLESLGIPISGRNNSRKGNVGRSAQNFGRKGSIEFAGNGTFELGKGHTQSIKGLSESWYNQEEKGARQTVTG